MFRLDPHALYTRQDLIDGLAPLGIDADAFLARLKPRKVFRMVWLGADLIAAFERAETLAERRDAPLPSARGKGGRRKGAEATVGGFTLEEIGYAIER